MSNSLRLELSAEPASVGRARHAIDELAERLRCDTVAVRTAVSELVGNCVSHAYIGLEPGPVIVLARLIRGRLVVTVADRGRGMQPRVDSPGLGLGLPLVSQLADDVRIDSGEQGAAISMGFECEAAAAREFRSGSADLAADLRNELERARQVLRRARERRPVRRRESQISPVSARR